MGTTEPRNKTDTVLKRIAWLSATDAEKQFDCLMHLFNEDSLAACFHALDGKKAVGVDGVRKADYGAELEDNLRQLVERMKRMGYGARFPRRGLHLPRITRHRPWSYRAATLLGLCGFKHLARATAVGGFEQHYQARSGFAGPVS